MSYLLPFIAALIGWVTNFLAIKMLFHPRKEIKILFLSIQGIFPKRQNELADKIGDLVAKELISIDDFTSKLKDNQNLEGVYELLEIKADSFLRNKLLGSYPMLSMFINEELIGKVKGMLMEELKASIPEIIEKYTTGLESSFDVKKVVRDKVVNFSLEKLEDVLFSIMKKEFKFIEIVGAVLGFFIGLIQLLLMNI